MVRRAPDSRLLANLIAHEKEHARHFLALFPLSHSALASLSAYALASPAADPASSPAQVIAAVVNALATADDALQRYARSLDAWRGQLVDLKSLEDDLAAVLRDRDILVTRLIKASKATRDAHRSSKLVPLAALGSASFSSLPSTNTSHTSTASTASTKLAQAHAELQACEAHLVAKERELDARRISVAREGLGARCRALIDCGWVWGEMGKQGLRALQALSANVNGAAPSVPPKTVRTSLSTSAIPHLSVSPVLIASDASSQSTSLPSAPTSQECRASKEHLPEAELDTPRPSTQRRTTDTKLTITLPPPHSISDVALPTSVRDPAPHPSNLRPAPVPRQRRTARTRRPPSQHILEVSDEGSDRPSSREHTVNVRASTILNTSTSLPTTPISSASHDSSSEDGAAIGPFEVVENNPFDVIRRSIIGPSPSLSLIPTVPSPSSPASASVPDVRTHETSPSRTPFPIQNANSASPLGREAGPNPSTPKRERRTSIAFFGSLRGLFRKPKERERILTEWGEGRSSPNTSTINADGKGGWVTRTDARIKGRTGEDSEDDPVPTPIQTSRVNLPGVGRQVSGARLRKGRPGAATRGVLDNAQHAASFDGWITDNPGNPNGSAATRLNRSRTHRATIKRRKLSVADLRGSEQGHTDGEMDGRTSFERVPSSKGIAKVPEGFVSATVSRHKPELVQAAEKDLASQGSRSNGLVSGTDHADSNANVKASTGIQRSTTTTAISGNKPSDGRATHRRSASLSHTASASFSSLNQGGRTPSSGSTSGSMSWRKPPPQLNAPPQVELRSRSPSPPKVLAHTRRPAGNGHAHSPSLMSIVADVVTRQHENERDKARPIDLPRAPGSVLREAEVRRTSLTMAVGESVQGQAQGRGEQQRVVKMPLRSALRNASRTPSPAPVSGVVSAMPAPPAMVEERVVSPLTLRDSASISSYETGRESFDGDERGVVLPPRSRSPSVPRSTHTPPVPPPLFSFPPPPVEPPPAGRSSPTVNASFNANPNANGDGPSSSASTETPPVTRRKSVRVSLQPTFSPTPPALCDDDGEGYAPWTESFSVRVQDERGRARARLEGARRRTVSGEKERGRKDVWVDSSDEDEAYSRARRLLSGGGGVGKGKGRAKA